MKYMTIVSIHETYRDDDNYRTTDTEMFILEDSGLLELYEKMAKYKTTETPEEKRRMEYTTVTFDSIYMIFEEDALDMSMLENTETWKNHLQKLEKKR